MIKQEKKPVKTYKWLWLSLWIVFMTFICLREPSTKSDGDKSYQDGYSAGIDTVFKIMDVQLRADTNTCTYIIFDDTLVYQLYRKPKYRNLKSK